MRRHVFFLVVAVFMALSVYVVEDAHAQQKGGGGGIFGGGTAATPLTLLNRADVKKELEITDQQTEKLPAEVLAAIGRVLDEKQMKRFKQLQLQQAGINAYKDVAVQTTLKMNAGQKKDIAGILEETAKSLAEFKGGFGGAKGKGGAAGNAEKTAAIRKEASEKINGVLTEKQRNAFRDLTGAEFKFTTPNFGGFNKAKDAKKDPPKDK